ncbi:glucosamine-6-phosphate deaminase [Tepidimicrobium xylanilyticum]|uniref:Glucosamine-6-phosphate deaminase n=1 Tax=Tepidimicrobium xylanilyticum TaxID=1123352 RepID=A0A1H2W453_9FIRM|nr:glucosamine-6-phosphate deaminase [Tepidimicrobium xylanilyticum]SDW75246.1 glucosamine-6-phosphate deaminase [Tepidimicrobium xylanilyticum]
MEVYIANDYTELCKIASKNILNVIKSKPNAILGLPTGGTSIGMYKELVKMYKEGILSFSKVTTFNLDEYEGLGKEDANSYYKFMYDNFFKHVDIKYDNINIPDGLASDSNKECEEYEMKIRKAGGMDLVVLGIGENGHIGFNEPSDFFSGFSYRVKLHEDTIRANSRFFNSADEVPKYALTMGIRTIMLSKKIMLLASGENKAKAIKSAIEGVITPSIPASILQLHRDVTVVLDKKSASLLSWSDSYKIV